MAWMSNTDRSIIATDSNSKLVCTPDIVCLHTIVGRAPAAAAHFSTSANGHTWQHRDTNRQSAANYYGNAHIIAIENEDYGVNGWAGVGPPPPFTAQQIESIAQICAWANKVHGIPLVACPNSIRGSKGIAYHRQGIDGNFGSYKYPGRVAGGEVWTTSFGKICPGDNRISQIPQIIQRARQIAGLEAGGEDMSQQDVDNLKGFLYAGGPSTTTANPAIATNSVMGRVQHLEAVLANVEGFLYKGGPSTADDATAGISADSVIGRLKAAEKDLAEIKTLLHQLVDRTV